MSNVSELKIAVTYRKFLKTKEIGFDDYDNYSNIMNRYISKTIWVIALNFLIIVAAGHGIACLGLIEIFWMRFFYGINTEDFSFSPFVSYDKSIGMAAMLSLTGQIFLILSLFLKRRKMHLLSQVIGLSLLWVGFFYLTHELFIDQLALFSFTTGLPFLILSILLLVNIIRTNRAKPIESDPA